MTEFVLSAFAIALLVGVAWALGFRHAPRLTDAAEAARIADAVLTGFQATDAVLDAQGRGALLEGGDGRLVLVRPLGDRWVVRVLGRAAAHVEGARLILRPRGAGERATVLDVGDAAARWARRAA